MSMEIGSSSIPRVKRKAQKPYSTPLKKRYRRMTTREQGEDTTKTEPSGSGDVKSMALRGISINDIPRYVSPTQLGEKLRKLTKNEWYLLKLFSLPEGMTFLVDIITALVNMRYEDHDLLLLKDVSEEPY